MTENDAKKVERQSMDVDIVCVGFGPAMGGFLTTLSRALLNEDGSPRLESAVMPGLPLQVVCYERADDLGFGVSGVVTRARAIRQSFPNLDCTAIPMTAPVSHEKVVYLLDPIGASRRSKTLRAADKAIRAFHNTLPFENEALVLPYIPWFLRKHDGLVMSLGQFNQWVGSELLGSGTVQIWPGTPVAEPLFNVDSVKGVRLLDQGVDKKGNPVDNDGNGGGSPYLPGMDIHAALTVVGDGPIGPIGRQVDDYFGLPEGHHKRDWAIGMKAVIDLKEGCRLAPGTVLHTFGFPEPEIFGFMYVYPGNVASVGIFVPSWFDSPTRTAYRYLQHWMMHPYIWQYLEGGTMRSWGAKSLEEAGRRGEPYLAGNGYARIGEGSGSTNLLTNSGVDEAWMTGILLAEAVIELCRDKKPFTQENLDATYVRRRRNSWVDHESIEAKNARDGFQHGIVEGIIGTALAGLTHGKSSLHIEPARPSDRLPSLEDYYGDRIAREDIKKIQSDCASRGLTAHAELMERCGWPPIPFDGKLLISHQDALLLGGKVQAAPGYADHIVFTRPDLCSGCDSKICAEICSGQAITPGAGGIPVFDREKCIHCGACVWSCAISNPRRPERTVLEIRAGVGGLHSNEN